MPTLVVCLHACMHVSSCVCMSSAVGQSVKKTSFDLIYLSHSE